MRAPLMSWLCRFLTVMALALGAVGVAGCGQQTSLGNSLVLLPARGDINPVMFGSVDRGVNEAQTPVIPQSASVAGQLIGVISDPNIAFLLLALGGLAFAFEVLHPTVFTGVLGAGLFILGLFALSTLPTNWAGLLLIVLAFALFIAEIHSGGIGVLGVGGAAALVFGGLLLVGGPGTSLEVSRPLVIGVTVLISVLFLWGISALYRSRRRPSVVGEQVLIGKRAVVRTALKPTGYVSVGGENWKATLDLGQAEPGESVTIISVRGLELTVRRTEPVDLRQASGALPRG
jgi:membrane-bound serine protease (ClpP class)